MASHDELKGTDLHEPSRAQILNSTSSELKVNDWVFLGVDENENGFIPVTALAGTNDKLVGIVTEKSIGTGNTGTVLTMGRITFDTSSFAVGNALSLVNTSGVFSFAVSTDPERDVGIVVTSSATGTIQIDTVSIGLSTTSGGATTLNQLTDVTITGLSDNQILRADSTGIFRNEDLPAAGVQLTVNGTSDQINVNTDTANEVTLTTTLGDTVIDSATDGQVLTYDDTLSQWQNEDLPARTTQLTVNQTDKQILVDDSTPNEVTLSSPIGDATVTNPGDGQIFAYDGALSEFKNREFSDLEVSLNEVFDVKINTPLNKQVLEFDSATSEWKNETISAVNVETIEDLEDVNVPANSRVTGNALISEAVTAFIELEADEDAVISFGVDTTDNLIIAAPSGSTAIDGIHFSIVRNQTNTEIDYSLSGGTLTIILDYMTGVTVDRDVIYTSLVTALETNFVDGERTVNGTVLRNNGLWTTETNPSHTPAATSAGSVFFTASGTGTTDTSAFNWNLNDGRGHISGTVALSNVDASAINTLVTAMVTGLNADSNFSPNYLASSTGATLTITSKATGAANNGKFSFVVAGFLFPANPSGIVSPSDSNFGLSGGADEFESSTLLQWLNTPHVHTITKPTPFGDATVSFKQGGFGWGAKPFDLPDLNDVDIDTSVGKQIILSENGTSNFVSKEATLESLDVTVATNQDKQGAILQKDATTGRWDAAGLRYGGGSLTDKNSFDQIPEERDYLIFDTFGGTDKRWVADRPVIGDNRDVDTTTTAPKEGDLLIYRIVNGNPVLEPATAPISYGEVGIITTGTTNAASGTLQGLLQLNGENLSEYNYTVESSGTNGYLRLRAGRYKVSGSIQMQTNAVNSGIERWFFGLVYGNNLQDVIDGAPSDTDLVELVGARTSTAEEGYVEVFKSDQINNPSVQNLEFTVAANQNIEVTDGVFFGFRWLTSQLQNGRPVTTFQYEDLAAGAPHTNLIFERVK